MPGDDKFAEAVRPALEALLSDLQHTTEVLRRANLSDRYGGSQDLEPIYQEQTRRAPVSVTLHNVDGETKPSEELNEVAQMIGRYSMERARLSPNTSSHTYSDAERRSYADVDSDYANTSPQPTNSATIISNFPTTSKVDERLDRPSVHSLLNQLDVAAGSKRSLGANSYNDVRRSPSQDPMHANSMIGTLKSDYSAQHGVNTIPKGDCAGCTKPIIGQVVIALGKMWHPEHFNCCECNDELGHRNFFERNGKAYCEDDYHNAFSPRCHGCNQAIRDRCVTAMGKNFHMQCFVCVECGREFGDEGFHERDGRAYCRRDFFRLFAPKCNGCQNAITNNFITALGTHWHPDCFVCQMCGTGFDGGSFFDHQGAPLCEQHYHEKRGSLCSVCRQPISGRCVSAMGLKFHPEHFRCTYCARQLTKGIFKEVDRKPFCHKCYNTTHALT
ncbi:unnamed protein product, partial [Mesorhabditis belari]|uniref:LIM zinc-binding domain-containing protein n=1 Tax=Mesorhabditis belari TaxID=2138241 RepID=A0AAF3EBF7_9BILA